MTPSRSLPEDAMYPCPNEQPTLHMTKEDYYESAERLTGGAMSLNEGKTVSCYFPFSEQEITEENFDIRNKQTH